MKFTNGYWLMRPEYEPDFACEYGFSRQDGRDLIVAAPAKVIQHRGDTLNLPLLTIRFSSPLPGVIRVAIVHHDGALKRGPDFIVNQDNDFQPEIRETDEAIEYISGPLTARISKKPGQWLVQYFQDGRLLTDSASRNMAHIRHRETGASFMTEQLALSVGETVYGLGERFTPFVKNGQTVDIWQADGGTASEQAYKNIPFYLSSRGYGIFIDDPGDVSLEIGSEKVERVQFSVPGQRLAYYVIAGPQPRDVLTRYTDLTGKPALPPAWSFGLWLTTSFTTSYDEETVTHFIEGMAERDIPLHVFHFDCFWMKGFHWCDMTWDNDVFPDPAALLRRLKERGLKICVWINPYIAQASEMFEEGREKGYLVRRTDGSIWQTDLWQAGMGLVDFTNPDAWQWYQDKLSILLDQGVDCFKTDFGERIPVRDIVWHNGSDPVRMHNYYTQLYNQAVFELLEHKLGRGEAVLFARSATAGGQKYPAHWGGDCSATYPSMAETLRGGLSLALSGFAHWSHDISGFEQTAPADIYKRWCAFGLLSSHSRLHGSSSYRVPWLFDDEACDVLNQFTRLKCRLMPYLYQLAADATVSGLPLMRPMMLVFPEDLNCRPLDQQYMLGDQILVAPVFNEEGIADYYLPEGRWTHLLSGEQREGGRWYHEAFGYDSLPLFVRDDSVIPLGAEDTKPEYDYGFDVTLNLYDLADDSRQTVVIPALDGQPLRQFEISRSGRIIRVRDLSQTGQPWRIRLAGDGAQAPQAATVMEDGSWQISRDELEIELS